MTTALSDSPTPALRRLDALLRRGFADEESRLYQVINGVLVALIFLSIVSVALASVESIYTAYKPWFDLSEGIIVGAFTLEYAINIYVARDKRKYIFGIWGIIDLLAILPSWLMVADLRALKVGRVLRVLRFLRLMRILRALKLAKVAARQAQRRQAKVNTLKLDLQIYLIALFSAVSIFSTLEYYAEARVPGHHLHLDPAVDVVVLHDADHHRLRRHVPDDGARPLHRRGDDARRSRALRAVDQRRRQDDAVVALRRLRPREPGRGGAQRGAADRRAAPPGGRARGRHGRDLAAGLDDPLPAAAERPHLLLRPADAARLEPLPLLRSPRLSGAPRRGRC